MKFITPPFKDTVTPEQYANAQIHWGKLIKGEISGEFDMEQYTWLGAYSVGNICGTAGCSEGYLPETLGLAISTIERDWKDDIDYDLIAEKYIGIDNCSDVWMWLFASYWTLIDNTPKGAAIRMRILFEQGLPENHEQQMYGNDPLMYQNEL